MLCNSGDLTGMMGMGTLTEKCFNGYNYYVLGWHSTQTNEITLVSGEAENYRLYGISDVANGGVVNIKAGEYFVTFNLKRDFNRGVEAEDYGELYPNQVLIHHGQDIKFGQTTPSVYSPTSLVASLAGANEKYSVAVNEHEKLIIQICSIDPYGSNGVVLSIGLDAADCLIPGVIHTPQSIQSLRSGVPIQDISGKKNEIIEFKMDLPYEPENVICTSFGGEGDVDLIMNFKSTPQVIYSDDVNTVSRQFLRGALSTM